MISPAFGTAAYWIDTAYVTRMGPQGDVKKLPPAEPMDLEHLHLAEVLDFRPDLGIIRLHEQRVVILSAAAMGLLRKELIDTLGLETARRLMLRFGYADGYHDAVSLRDRSRWESPLDGLKVGAILHRLEGIVRAEILEVDHDAATGRFQENVVWHDSYVAEQHLHHYGKSTAPVCWSLVGYASGYVSACLGQEIYFRETECLGQGAKQCSVVGKDAASWGDALEALRSDFQSVDLGHEVEKLRDVMHRQHQELDRRERLLE
jgi:two-component system response regulator HydG